MRRPVAPYRKHSSSSGSKLFLGVETSCDDTAVAVLRQQDAGAQVVWQQRQTHHQMVAQYGGVKPDEAARFHARHLQDMIEEGMMVVRQEQEQQVQAVVVTAGPGLAMCLRQGLRGAARLAYQERVPLIPVHHLEAHLLVCRMVQPLVQVCQLLHGSTVYVKHVCFPLTTLAMWTR